MIPRPIAGVDVRALPIGPKEAFVLSHVDGHTTDRDIGLFTGLSPAEVQGVLSNLASLGAIQYGAAAQEVAAPGAPPDSGRSGTHVRISQPPPSSVPTLYEPEELAEEVDIADDRKRVILSAFYGLEKTTHYELLEVPRTADKKDIKAAYFDRIAIFHPDRYFGKNLGSFKAKMEQVFQRMTDAHDTLTRSQKRTDYDRYLESQTATRALDAGVASEQAERVRAEIEEEARRLGEAPTIPPPPGTEMHGPRSATTPARQEIAPAPSRTPTPEERRQHFARKLGAGPAERFSRPQMAAPPVPPKDALKARYEQRLEELKTGRVARFVQQANDSLAAGNKVAAANALRIAVSLVPEDGALAARLSDVEQQASATLAEQYLEQARYEEGQRAFDKAAVAYERAARGRNSSALYDRAGACLLEANGDARKAVELCRKAVDLSPQTGNLRITLARAYARAGLEKSALAELDRALTSGVANDVVKDWERRVRRGEV